MRRLLPALALALASAAALFWQAPATGPTGDSPVLVTDLLTELRDSPRFGPLRLTGIWQLTSSRPDFGGYSAIQALGEDRFVAISDRNTALHFALPRPGVATTAAIHPLFPGPPRKVRQDKDCEALTVDPASGEIWAAFEGAKSYWVFSPDFAHRRRVAAPVLLNWPGNEGPEAMARMADGRFVMLIEARAHWLSRSRHPALLYPAAPHDTEAPLQFQVEMPEGFRPTDAAPLPDGRALVLGRDLGIGDYRTVIGVLDLAGAKAGTVLPVRELARITDGRISDNYEAMAVTRSAQGLTIWLMSDDNQSVWLQRTLLLRLEWPFARRSKP